MHLRSTYVAAVATFAVVAGAGPASAHEEINPKTIPTGQAAFLTLTAANEASVDLIRIVLRAPGGLGFGEATRSPAGWSATATDNTITWTGGAVKPHTFESWGFEVESADQPATLTFPVTLGYAGGKTDDHEVDVTAAAPATGGASAGGSPAATVTTADSATSTSPATASAAPNGTSGGSDGESGMAKAALAVSIVALLVAAGALAAGPRRRRGGPGPNGTSGGGTAAGAAQDW